ncbi:MAG: N-acetyltransferase family protein [Dongiaceae bacterium]
MIGSVRAATVGDADDIAIVHVTSWRETYPSIVPRSVLDGLSTVERAERWRSILNRQGAYDANFVACDHAGMIVGFASAGPQRYAASSYDGEIYAVYVLRCAQGRGLGRSLMGAMARSLCNSDRKSANVWVAARNIAACQFYASLGGRFVAVSSDVLGGVVIDAVAYGWDDLSNLARRR